MSKCWQGFSLKTSLRPMLLQVGKLVLQAQARDMDPVHREQRKPGIKQKQAALPKHQVGSTALFGLCRWCWFGGLSACCSTTLCLCDLLCLVPCSFLHTRCFQELLLCVEV